MNQVTKVYFFTHVIEQGRSYWSLRALLNAEIQAPRFLWSCGLSSPRVLSSAATSQKIDRTIKKRQTLPKRQPQRKVTSISFISHWLENTPICKGGPGVQSGSRCSGRIWWTFYSSVIAFNSESKKEDSKIIWWKLKSKNKERWKSAIYELRKRKIIEPINNQLKQVKSTAF